MIKENDNQENQLWLQVAESSLDFWNDLSNDIYRQLL